MFRRIRIAVLVYILLFVALGNYLTASRSRDWNDTLWVDVYPVNADGSGQAEDYIEALTEEELEPIEAFFVHEAETHGLSLERPFRFELAPALDQGPPPLPASPSWLTTLAWSLQMRWYVFRLNWKSDRPTADIVLFALYHEPRAGAVIERSGALSKNQSAIANLFASRSMRGENQVVVAHELLHTVGATDKYDPISVQPSFPAGYAEPSRDPLFPQSKAELMGGRIPLSPEIAETPMGLAQAVIGPLTAAEIGWPTTSGL